MLVDENTVSDLIAYLFTTDPKPFMGGRFADLIAPRMVREKRLVAVGGKSLGRADLVLEDADGIVALFEVKVGAGEHNAQLGRYLQWVNEKSSSNRVVQGFVLCLDLELPGMPPEFQLISLSEAFESFGQSPHPGVSWLAHEVAGVFADWLVQRDGILSQHDSRIVADLAVKQTAFSLRTSEWAEGIGWWHHSEFRVDGPESAIYSFTPVMDGLEGVATSVDVRAGSHIDATIPWSFRLGIDVGVNRWTPVGINGKLEKSQFRSLETAQLLALTMANGIRQQLTLRAFQDFLNACGQPRLAESFRPNTKYGTGLPSGQAVFGFYNDLKKRRLSNSLKIDVTALTRIDLEVLIKYAHEYLIASLRSIDLAGIRALDMDILEA